MFCWEIYALIDGQACCDFSFPDKNEIVSCDFRVIVEFLACFGRHLLDFQTNTSPELLLPPQVQRIGMQQILKHMTLDLHQILNRQQLFNLIYVLLPIFLIFKRTQYFEIQLTLDPFVCIAFLDLLLMLLKLLEYLE